MFILFPKNHNGSFRGLGRVGWFRWLAGLPAFRVKMEFCEILDIRFDVSISLPPPQMGFRCLEKGSGSLNLH